MFWPGQISDDKVFEAVFVDVSAKGSAWLKGYFGMKRQAEL